MAAEPASVLPPPPAGETPVASLFNADGLGYGLFPLDPDILVPGTACSRCSGFRPG